MENLEEAEEDEDSNVFPSSIVVVAPIFNRMQKKINNRTDDESLVDEHWSMEDVFPLNIFFFTHGRIFH